jgi:Uncharacterised nucleotidyltransferase
MSGMVAALAWGIGGRSPTGDQLGFDSDTYIRAVREHRIAGRLIARNLREPQPWISPGLLTALHDEHRWQRQVFADRTELARELVRRYGPRHDPLIFLKGFSAHFLTGRRDYSARASTDIDFFAGNNDAVLGMLADMGYEFDRRTSPHEVARLGRGNSFVELHGYVPVFAGVDTERVPAVFSSDVRRAPVHAFARNDVRYPDVRANSTSLTSEGVELTIPNIEMTTLIAYAHCYRNQISMLGPSMFATVRLSELAEIREMVSWPHFRIVRFRELVRQFDARLAVEFVDDLTAAIMRGDDVRSEAPALDLRRSLWWDQGQGAFVTSTTPAETPEDLVIRTSGMRQLLGLLGANDLAASSSLTSSAEYSTLPGERGGRPLRIRASHTIRNASLDVGLSAAWTHDGLEFTVKTFTIPGHRHDRETFIFNFGTSIFSCGFSHSNAEVAVTDLLGDDGPDMTSVSMVPESPGIFRIRLGWPATGAGFTHPKGHELFLMIGARRRRDQVPLPYATTLIPLRLTRPG